ncbi:MAG: hypothetical protein ACU88J_11235 [Gammaproteobacteria bacterium]
MKSSPLLQFDGVLLDGLEFCSKVYALYESIRSATDGASRMRRRPTQVEKKLLEELLPICRYVQVHYRTGRYISVRWLSGNQQYDAEILQRGAYVNHNQYPAKAFLEVTCTMHPKDYLMRELLDTKGGGFGLEGIRRLKGGEIESVPVSYRNQEFVESYAKLLLTGIAKKAKIPYPKETTLIIHCTLNLPYMPDEWESLISRVKGSLPRNSFREIYLYEDLSQYSRTLYPQ